MPRLSDSMEEGTILRWLVDDGTEVAVGQEIVEIETDKATMPYEADEAGVLTEWDETRRVILMSAEQRKARPASGR